MINDLNDTECSVAKDIDLFTIALAVYLKPFCIKTRSHNPMIQVKCFFEMIC